MKRYKWYYFRLMTMSPAEMLYRIRQIFIKTFEKYFSRDRYYNSVNVIKSNLVFDFEKSYPKEEFFIFGKKIDINSPLDFHKDIFSGKSFPKTFSKSIDIRSDKYGSAKVVWEINRLQFLVPLILKYRSTGNKTFLELFVSILVSWDKQNPYLKGVNWYSNIEVNIRLINWYWCWILLEGDPIWDQDEKYATFRHKVWLPLIYMHCWYSSKNLSYYSSANNHLIAEYAGLFIASTLWKFPKSESWLVKCKRGLERQIQLQYTENGINREEAAEYIQFITDFFLLSYIAGLHHNIAFSEEYEERLKVICSYINNFLDCRNNFPKYGDEDDGRVIIPDGNIYENNFISILNTAVVLFNRPIFKREHSCWDVKSNLLTAHIQDAKDKWMGYDFHTNSHSAFYQPEGHFIFKNQLFGGKEIYCHFDAAPLGYLSIAAHGHADALSLLLHIDGYPFLVDPGTYTYHTHKVWRKYFVSTLAHNTLTVNGLNQATLAGPTLWVNHYKAHVHKTILSDTADFAEASHNGYRKLGVSHTRSVNFDKLNNIFTIEDVIEASSKNNIRLQMPFHLDPAVTVAAKEEGSYLLRRPETTASVEIKVDPLLKWSWITASDAGPLGWYSPSFMKKEKSSVIIGEYFLDQFKISLNTFIKIII